MLNENVVKLLKNGMWDLATCADGEPNVVPVAFKDVPPDDKLVIGDVFLDTTLKNIAANNGKIAISAFAALVSMGGAPKASIFLGKGENEQAERVVGSCTWMLLLLSVLLTGIMLAFGRSILLLFGASADTILFASDYMNIYCLGTVFTQMTLGLNAFITAQGKTLVCMGNVAVGAATNLVLDAVLINGFHRGVRKQHWQSSSRKVCPPALSFVIFARAKAFCGFDCGISALMGSTFGRASCWEHRLR